MLFGESLGAAVATRLARERPVAALVLRSPFTSLADVGARHYRFLPVRTLSRARFPVRDTVGTVTVPVHVVAGGADEVVPASQSRAVAAAAGASYIEVPGAGHNDPELCHGLLVVDAVVRASRCASGADDGMLPAPVQAGAQPSARAGCRAPPPG